MSGEGRASRVSSVSLLIEIGCEEIPARMLPAAGAEFQTLIVLTLDEFGADSSTSKVFWTPRRLGLLVPGLKPRIPRKTAVFGPSVSATWSDGSLTPAGLGFLRKYGKQEEDLGQGSVGGTPRVFVNVGAAEISLSDYVCEELPKVVTELHFGKTMRWGDGEFRFVRPVHWVVALAGHEVIPVSLFGVAATRVTQGHRTLGPGPYEVSAAAAWESVLAAAGVTVDPEQRRETLRAALARAAAEHGGRPVEDPELLSESADMVEHPGALAGTFDARYVRDLPKEILETCLRHHQKAFLVVNDRGPLPVFAVAVNVKSDPEGHVRRGHEWVASGRLADALFFWNEDRKKPLADRVPALEGVVFQQDLGSYGAKTLRVRRLARRLAESAGLAAARRLELDRAAQLARADLVTGLVGEFPELQGVVGGLLARADGEPESAADAIYNLYTPGSPDGPLPEGEPALLLGAADRLDTLVGAFAVGLAPTGSKDPFGLRRAGAVLVRIARRLPWLDLAAASRLALDGFDGGESGPDLRGRAENVSPRLVEFLFERFAAVLPRWIPSVRYDEINAVRSFARDEFVAADLSARVNDMQSFRTSDDFYALALASKRVRNILAQARDRGETVRPGEGADELVLPEELALSGKLRDVAQGVEKCGKVKAYAAAYGLLASLRPTVDLFFDKVLVMDENPRIRRARLGLLAELHALTHGIVDMSEIVVEGGERSAD